MTGFGYNINGFGAGGGGVTVTMDSTAPNHQVYNTYDSFNTVTTSNLFGANASGGTLVIPTNTWLWTQNVNSGGLTVNTPNLRVINYGRISGYSGGGNAIKVEATGVNISNESGAFIAAGGGNGSGNSAATGAGNAAINTAGSNGGNYGCTTNSHPDYRTCTACGTQGTGGAGGQQGGSAGSGGGGNLWCFVGGGQLGMPFYPYGGQGGSILVANSNTSGSGSGGGGGWGKGAGGSGTTVAIGGSNSATVVNNGTIYGTYS